MTKVCTHNSKYADREMKKMRQKITSITKKWFYSGNNIFKTDVTDALMYIALYVAMPIMITAVDLLDFPTGSSGAAYPYLCIIISALNCLYDIKNRWDNGAASISNTKLFIMGVATTIVLGYAVFEVLLLSRGINLTMRCDAVLCIYFVSSVVSLIDALSCLGTKLTIIDHTDSV